MLFAVTKMSEATKNVVFRHCEEQSDEAIQKKGMNERYRLDCFAKSRLAMTKKRHYRYPQKSPSKALVFAAVFLRAST